MALSTNRPSLLIPVRGSDENVEVFIDELPEDADDILAILQAEIAPLDIWLKFAVEYYRQGKIESFLKILNEGTDPGLEEYYSDSKAERIALLNALASYYTQLASREKKDKAKKDEYFGQATGSFNKADKIDAFEFLTWVGKGVLFLCKGDLDRATYNFDTVLQTTPDNIPALMGKACVQYNKGQYQEALTTYKSILVKNPACPAAIRLGLGYCFYKLGRSDLARQAFERVLQLDPNNVEALVGLAIFELNTEKQGSITSAMQMLKKAFEANNTNSMVLNHLANHFFYKKDYKKVNNLALQAYHNTEVPQTKAFSCYLLAKAFHANEDYDQAYNYYAQALRHWPSFDLAQFGVAQMLLHKGQTEQAITYFESVLTSHPDNFETLKILGALYAQAKNSKDKARGYLKKATDLNSGDYEAWIELAHLTELTDAPGALSAYEKAKQLLQKRREKVSAELWNNLAVLRHKLGNLKGAEEAYKGALIASGNVNEAGEFTKEVKAQTVTMLYNLARLYEDMHDPSKAEELYLSIVKEHPNYVDCYMRLGCIERDRKQYKAASTWFEECLIIHHEHPDTWALIGNMHLGKEEWQQAQKKFEKIIEKDRSDPYSLLSLGNIYYNAKFHTAEKEAKYIRLANDFYWKVLQKNPANIYAANGVGIVVAEKGEIGLAKEFFTQISEASESMADVRLNLAHIHFAQGMFINAVKLYQNCLKKYYENKDPDALLCLARAYYEWNKMDECKQTIQKAIHIDPTNQLLWYNLAIAQHKNATILLQQKAQKRTFQDLQAATNDLNYAIATFTMLSHPRSGTKPAYSVSKAQRYVKLCSQLKQDVSAQLEEAKRIEDEQNKKKEEQRARQEETERALREQKAKEEAEAEMKQAEKDRALRELLEHQSKVIEKYVNPEPVPEEEPKGKKSKKGKGKKKGKKGEENEEMQEEQEEEDSEKKEKKRRRKDEEDGERPEKRKSKKRSKRIVESDEEEQTGEAEATGEEATGEEATGEAAGEEATGEEATGEEATGEEATGEEATGEEATGEEATGEEATGEDGMGEEATGEEATGEEATGEEATGEEATAEEATGEEATGEEATGEEATGEEATGEEATGEEATGEEATGEEATGEEATGEEATGEEAMGEEATGEEATGEEATGEEASGEAVAEEATAMDEGATAMDEGATGEEVATGEEATGEEATGEEGTVEAENTEMETETTENAESTENATMGEEVAEGMEGVVAEQNGEESELQATQVDVDMPPTQVD